LRGAACSNNSRDVHWCASSRVSVGVVLLPAPGMTSKQHRAHYQRRASWLHPYLSASLLINLYNGAFYLLAARKRTAGDMAKGVDVHRRGGNMSPYPQAADSVSAW